MANKVTFPLNLRYICLVFLSHASFLSYLSLFYMWVRVPIKAFGSSQVYRHVATSVIRVNFSAHVYRLSQLWVDSERVLVKLAMTMRLRHSLRSRLLLHISPHKLLQ